MNILPAALLYVSSGLYMVESRVLWDTNFFIGVVGVPSGSIILEYWIPLLTSDSWLEKVLLCSEEEYSEGLKLGRSGLETLMVILLGRGETDLNQTVLLGMTSGPTWLAVGSYLGITRDWTKVLGTWVTVFMKADLRPLNWNTLWLSPHWQVVQCLWPAFSPVTAELPKLCISFMRKQKYNKFDSKKFSPGAQNIEYGPLGRRAIKDCLCGFFMSTWQIACPDIAIYLPIILSNTKHIGMDLIIQANRYMNKSSLPQQRSCLDLSRYKFIPPSKLLQVKPQPSPPMPAHFQSLMQEHLLEESSGYSNKPEARGLASNGNKQNLKREARITGQSIRDVSNPQLGRSNSRNAMLKMKNPPIQLTRVQQLHDNHFGKLTQYIEELKAKNSSLTLQLADAKEQNQSLSDRLNKTSAILVLKNKQITDLGLKLRDMQLRAKQKCQQHSLIIESLKKVIESQLSRITQLSNKHKQPKANQANRFEYVYEPDSSEHSESSSSRRSGKIESLIYDQPVKNKKSLEVAPNQIQSLLGEFSKHEEPTPSFGARTPKDSSLLATCKQDTPSLDCSLEQPANLSLSRISESVEEDYDTERQSNKPEKNARTQPSMSTHQQLLDEIDQYLSKRNKNIRK